MKMLTTIIRPEKLEAVQAVLQPQEACLVCVSEVQGYGAEPALQTVYRGSRNEIRPMKLRLEITVEDLHVDEVIDEITQAAASKGSGRLGDGAIFVTTLVECVRIGRDERNLLATGA